MAREEDLPFQVVRIGFNDEVLARAGNLLIGKAAYYEAVKRYPYDTLQYRDRARVIENHEGTRPR
jgi:hypothetical protein